MFDPLSAVVGVLIFAVGFLFGRRRRRAGQMAAAKQPICGCRDHLALHDLKTGKCHGVHTRTVVPKGGKRPYDVTAPCGCQRYVGPEPIRDVWVPPPAIDLEKPAGQ